MKRSMSVNELRRALLLMVPLGSCALGGVPANLEVVSTSPARHALAAPIAPRISITFDRAVNRATVNEHTVRVFGRWSGPLVASFTYSNSDLTVTAAGNRPFTAGDLITVYLSDGLAAADGSPMRAAGYTYQFWTRTRQASMSFSEVDTFTNRINNAQTRIYGAAAVDLNSDGWLDLTTINEVSNDVRVFLNTGDAIEPYSAMLAPHPISHEASPNDTGDFNNDGKADVCTAATFTSTVWILLGNGNGTFAAPGQEIDVPDAPHGIAVLDVEGDGDTDIATANTGGNNVAILLNNGSGVFTSGPTFEGGGSGEYALGAGDMNNDGILDLVVGAISSQRVIVHLGNGNGTFTQQPFQSAGGQVWMIALGDVNEDGNLDVSTANSFSNSGSILLGNGDGTLGAPAVVATAGHTPATDLGDLDGDGDQDWVLSSYGGQNWRMYTNNGSGSFTFGLEFPAPNNPSCAIFLDFDNDRDMDLVLTDEIADVLITQRNGSIAPIGDFATDGDVDASDFAQFSSCFTGEDVFGYAGPCELGDFDGDGDIDCSDYDQFSDAWTAGGDPPAMEQCVPPIPAASTWGLVVLALLTMSAGTIVLKPASTLRL